MPDLYFYEVRFFQLSQKNEDTKEYIRVKTRDKRLLLLRFSGIKLHD